MSEQYYTAHCMNCEHEFQLEFKDEYESGIIDCPECRHPDFQLTYESGYEYEYVLEEDTPGVEKRVRRRITG